MRIRSMICVLIGAMAVVAGPAVASPENSGTPGVTLDISPHDPLPDAASLAVTGAGFGVNLMGTLMQCTVDSVLCSNSLGNWTSNASGSFSANVNVTRTFVPSGGGGAVDCGVTACQLEALSNSGAFHSKHTLDYAGPIRTLTVAKSGSGTVTGSGIDCGSDCNQTFNHATQVTLTATPGSGQVFAGWTGCDSPSGNSCTMAMTADKSLHAAFVASGSGGGGGGGGNGGGAGGSNETCAGQTATLTGTQESETITGTSGPDVIAALGGNDTVKGGAGNDLICGGAGKDTLKGGSGKDKLFGGQGKDKLSGGGQKDTCNGGGGKDTGSACEKGPDS